MSDPNIPIWRRVWDSAPIVLFVTAVAYMVGGWQGAGTVLCVLSALEFSTLWLEDWHRHMGNLDDDE